MVIKEYASRKDKRSFKLLIGTRAGHVRGIIMKKSEKFVKAAFIHMAALLLANAFCLTGCGKIERDSLQESVEAQSYEILEVQNIASETQQERSEVQDVVEMVQAQEAQADVFSRAYSDKESKRSKELWQEYGNGKYPEYIIVQVDNAEAVTEGVLCYVKATGEYHLPDREMTDEELLEIIDFQHKMGDGINKLTQAQINEENLEKRRILEEKVQAAGEISEEKAIEIAKKAMESDIGERRKGLRLYVDETSGWSTELCIADWEEIKEKDKGKIAYYIIFNNVEDGMEITDMLSFNCTVSAIDGRILEAYLLQDAGDNVVYYEH